MYMLIHVLHIPFVKDWTLIVDNNKVQILASVVLSDKWNVCTFGLMHTENSTLHINFGLMHTDNSTHQALLILQQKQIIWMTGGILDIQLQDQKESSAQGVFMTRCEFVILGNEDKKICELCDSTFLVTAFTSLETVEKVNIQNITQNKLPTSYSYCY